MGTNYNDPLMQLHRSADYQYEQHVYEGSTGFQYPLLDEVNTAQARWDWPDTSPMWLLQDADEMYHQESLESFNLDPQLEDTTTGPSYKPTIVDTIFPDHSGCPRPDDQNFGLEMSSGQD